MVRGVKPHHFGKIGLAKPAAVGPCARRVKGRLVAGPVELIFPVARQFEAFGERQLVILRRRRNRRLAQIVLRLAIHHGGNLAFGYLEFSDLEFCALCRGLRRRLELSGRSWGRRVLSRCPGRHGLALVSSWGVTACAGGPRNWACRCSWVISAQALDPGVTGTGGAGAVSWPGAGAAG